MGFYSIVLIVLCSFLSSFNIRAETTGRDENIEIRKFKPKHARAFSGPYQGGEAEKETKASDYVLISGNRIPVDEYEILYAAKFIPMLQQMKNTTLMKALKTDLSEELFVEKIKEKASLAKTILPEIWGLTNLDQGKRVEASYEEWFSSDGTLLQKDFFKISPPYLEMLRWAYYYRQTNDPKWAAAVRDIYLEFYRNVRPPAQKVRNVSIGIRTMWHPLGAGSGTPMLIEAYLLIANWPGLSVQDHLDILKSFLERGRYLRYTTVPYGPWPEYSPFGYGNWILYQLQGLLAISATFPEFKESKEWSAHSCKGIGILADWLVLPDSGISEYSYDYANQITSQFEWCYMMLSYYSLPFPERFKQNVLRMHELFLVLVEPNNIKIPFGDTARGVGNAHTRCAWAALAFLDGRFKYWQGSTSKNRLNALAHMLHPEDSKELLKKFEELKPVAPVNTSMILPETGWVIMRSGWDPESIVFALTYKTSENVYHSGYETLGFNLWRGGEPLMGKLLGQKGYEHGYPDGYRRTPKLANLVLIKDAAFTRESGSLRNWYSSHKWDYLEIDHLGWDNGNIRIARRVLFLKPNWILLIDDVLSSKKFSASWQAHTDKIRPNVQKNTSLIYGDKSKVSLAFLNDTKAEVQQYHVESHRESGFLLSATKITEDVARFVTLMRVDSMLNEEKMRFKTISQPGAEGVEIRLDGKDKQIWWEDSVNSANRFLSVCTDGALSFLSSDANEAAFVKNLLETNSMERHWNNRLIDTEMGADLPIVQYEECLLPEEISISNWSGIEVLNTVKKHVRMTWKIKEPAVHSVLYRVTGDSQWQRQFQPGKLHQAWILLPDLLPGKSYQIKTVSEFSDGRVYTSPVIDWNVGD